MMETLQGLNGYNEITASGSTFTEQLPAGGYVLQIIGVKLEQFANSQAITMQVEIAEGEQKGFFRKQYDRMSDEYKKWKGIYRLYIPQNRGNEERYKKSLSFFKGQIEAVNQSNGCNINPSKPWNPEILKSKFVGGLFGRVEWYMPENLGETSGWYVKCKRLCNAQDIRDGNYKTPKDEPSKKKQEDEKKQSQTVNSPWEVTGILSEDEIPF